MDECSKVIFPGGGGSEVVVSTFSGSGAMPKRRISLSEEVFQQKLKVKLTLHKVVDPLDVWKHRIPKAVPICAV